jgi:hypothetical protein
VGKSRGFEAVRGIFVVLLFSPVIVLAVFAATAPKIEDTTQSREASPCTSRGRIYAEVFAEVYVKTKLKAPSTAKFAGPEAYSTWWVGECKFAVSSYVDAENSFGAQVRNKFTAKVHYDPREDRWYMDRLFWE